MLELAGIGLDAGDVDALGSARGPRQVERIGRRCATGAVVAGGKIDHHRQALAGGASGGGERTQVFRVIDRHAEALMRHPVQRHQPRDLGLGHLGRSDMHPGNAAADHHLGFAERHAGDADGSRLHLAPRDFDRFMGLGMGPQCDPGGFGMRRHGRDIAFQRVEIDHQGRGVEQEAASRPADQPGIGFQAGRRNGHAHRFFFHGFRPLKDFITIIPGASGCDRGATMRGCGG